MSLRLRLALGVGLVALVALAAADVAVYGSFRTSLVSSIDATLDAARAPIARQLAGGVPPGPGNPGPGGTTGPITSRQAGRPAAGAPAGTTTTLPSGGTSPDGPGATESDEPFCLRAGAQLGAGTVVELRNPRGSLIANSSCVGGAALAAAATPIIPPDAPRPTATGSGPEGLASSVHFDAASTGVISYRVDESLLSNGDTLVLAAPLTSADHSLSRLLLEEIVTSLVALALAIALGSWLVRLGLRPLLEVEHAANAITAGDLSQRVPGDERKTEVGTVALAINTMLRRIEGAFRERDETEDALRASEGRLRRFVADASHELRTPIAAVGAYAELFSSGAAEPEHRADLERVMAGIRSENTRMGGLVEDLLLLARLDDGRPLEMRPVELVAMCSEAIRTAAAVGPDWPVTLEAAQPVELVADPFRLRQVVDNLLANVRAHTPSGTAATVRVSADRDTATIEVIDGGPGFDPDDVGRVFERFYRADPSRARSSGGSGLGLSIVASIVAGHGGSVTAHNGEGGGAVVSARFPLGTP